MSNIPTKVYLPKKYLRKPEHSAFVGTEIYFQDLHYITLSTRQGIVHSVPRLLTTTSQAVAQLSRPVTCPFGVTRLSYCPFPVSHGLPRRPHSLSASDFRSV